MATADGGKGTRPTRWGGRVCFGLALGVLVFASLTIWGDGAAMRGEVAKLRWADVLLLLGLSFGSYLLRFAKWRYYCGIRRIRLPLTHDLALFLSGFTLTATPGKLGEILKAWLLKRSRGIDLAETAPIVVAERLTDFTALLALTALGSSVLPGGRTIMAVGLSLTVAFLAFMAHRPLVMAILKAAERPSLTAALARKGETAYESMRSLVTPSRLLWATLLSLPAWALECFELWLLLRGLGSSLPFRSCCFVYAGTSIVGALSMLPGGLGAMEGSMTGLLVQLGVARAAAASAVLVVRLTTLWFAVGLGALVLAGTHHLFAPPEGACSTPLEGEGSNAGS